MLEQLFGSQTRSKLLQVFLSNPEEKYFVRELTRLLDSQIHAVRRELENLEELGIIKLSVRDDKEKSAESRRKFYQVNTKSVLYNELKSIFQKAQFFLEKNFANSLKKIGKIYYLALTGFFTGTKEIPIDMLIVGRLNKKKLERILKNFEKNFKKEINYTLLDKDEFDYRRSVADKFLYSILDADKIVMVDEIFNKLQEHSDITENKA
jgi:predicted transcriptional regulator